jgi:hypothetical protein
MTVSAIRGDSLPSSIDEVDLVDPQCHFGASIMFLEKHIDQLVSEKDMLQKNADSFIATLELHIRKLSLEREALLRELRSSTRRRRRSPLEPSGICSTPVEPLCAFLSACDIFNLSATSKELFDQCHPASQKKVIPHMSTPSRYTDLNDAAILVEGICLGMVTSLSIDAKKSGGKALMDVLSSRGSEMKALRAIRVSAAAEAGDFLSCLERFMAGLPENQLESVHFSGLRTIALVSKLISRQRLSLQRFKVDYFVNGHEQDVTEIPEMPNIRSFVFDVADVVHLPVHVISNVLQAVTHKDSVETIYLPHMQITGQSHEIVEFVELLKQFNNARQLVIRFRRLPLSVKEIVSLRESFEALPAVCISDHFIVMLDSWATWWPKQSSIWPSADRITGLSVFREQIDFESLGTTATREWLRLSREQKDLWSRRIARNVAKLFLKQETA